VLIVDGLQKKIMESYRFRSGDGCDGVGVMGATRFLPQVIIVRKV
jgi:hypothetical protein